MIRRLAAISFLFAVISLTACRPVTASKPSATTGEPSTTSGKQTITTVKQTATSSKPTTTAVPPSQTRQVSAPIKLNLPTDFVATKADYLDHQRDATGWNLGSPGLRGNGIKKRNGIFPIYVRKAEPGEFPGDPIKKGDLLIGVNGRPMVEKRPVMQFVRAYNKAQRLHESGELSVMLWRRGEIKTVKLELPSKVPDLTKGGKPTAVGDWQLGPTGMNGWVYCKKTPLGASRDARQILVTFVEKNSPADGKIQVGDVIIGVGRQKFDRDVRRAFAEAINEAEKAANGGKLNLMIWRRTKEDAGADQDTITVTLMIGTMPEASETSPYDCPKTDKIISNATDYILRNKRTMLKANGGAWLSYINGLGLLATGRQDAMQASRELARASLLKDGKGLGLNKPNGMACWWWSYKTIFLCEYYLATGDDIVLPTIREYATKIAMGQSGVGSWGHSYAVIENDGKLHGRLDGYGAINQQGLTLMIALLLAEKCGVRNQEISDAIMRGSTFFGNFIGRGAIPYGDHLAHRTWFDDNGKSGSAAVMFELLNNSEGKQFYSSMVVASASSGREIGHSGCFWSHLWGGIGAARGGKNSTISFMKEMDYAFTLERHASGRLAFQGNAGEKNGFGTKGSTGVLKKEWDATGARLLQLCLPRKKIYLTGKGSAIENPLSSEDAQQLVEDGRLLYSPGARRELGKDDIFRLLSHRLPPVRYAGVQAINEQKLQLGDELITMLDSPNRFARYGACRALKGSSYQPKRVVARLIRILEDEEDLYLKICAMDALCGEDPKHGLTRVAQPAIPTLLRLTTKRSANDPRRSLQRYICSTLFGEQGLITLHGTKGIDNALLIPAIREILTAEDGKTRGIVSTIYPKLTQEQRQQLWGDIYHATKTLAPSGIMAADIVRVNGLMLMQKDGIEEGIPLAMEIIGEKRWGGDRRQKGGVSALGGYGPAAKEALPILLNIQKRWATNKKIKTSDRIMIKKTIDEIQSGNPKELISIKELLHTPAN